MLYITTDNAITNSGPITLATIRNYQINEADLHKLIDEELCTPIMLQNDEDRDNYFINRFGIPVEFEQAPMNFRKGDKLVVYYNHKLRMVIFDGILFNQPKDQKPEHWIWSSRRDS